MGQESINKTIVVSYDDITRMKDFCCDEDGVTKDFMDWYVNDNAFFSKTGIFIIENVTYIKKFTISFDFNNPNNPEFTIYDYNTQKVLCEYYFNREDNLSMKDITVEIKWFDKTIISNIKNIGKDLQHFILTKEILTNTVKEVTDLVDLFKKRKIKSIKTFSKKVLEEWSSKGGLIKLYSNTAIQSTYFCYAMMYYFSKNKYEEITGVPKNNLSGDGILEKIITKYKYTGYVNLNETTKIYKPVIKKDDNEPTREYDRHIEKWSVRGHYRRINGNLIWIEAHEKGEGTLEKRIYGTENESKVKVIPKVFEVERTITKNVKEEIQEHNITIVKEHPIVSDSVKIKEIPQHSALNESVTGHQFALEKVNVKKSRFKRVLKWLFNWF